MSHFAGALMLRALSPGEVAAAKSTTALYQVLEDFYFISDYWGAIGAPAGFVTDFASIPRAALWYIRDDDPGILFPSVIHDALYTKPLRAMTRSGADDVLADAMGVCGARKDQIAVVRRVVGLFGGAHWQN